jgi:hypothetical protein
MTFGGMFPLGGFGEPFLPHPDNMNVDVIQAAETRVNKTEMHRFAMVLFFNLPTPMIYLTVEPVNTYDI